MSLKRNILANYGGQLYASLIAIVLVPLYVKLMGAEAYGLVGFYAMLQAWFALLDMGLTPTMGRETARFDGGAVGALGLRQLLRSLEGIFLVTGLLGAALIAAAAPDIASRWLKVQLLSLDEVSLAVSLMGVIVALRWVGGLYRGAINGFEHIVWLSGFNAGVATLRFAVVVPVLLIFGPTPTTFFVHQLLVALLELVMLTLKTYRLLPALDSKAWVRWQWQPLKGVLKFALTIAFTGAIWIVVTQTDKLLLSGLIPLSDYACFTLAVLLASGITLLSAPVGGAIVPRLTRLNAQGDETDLVRLYRRSTQLVAVIAVPIVLMLSCFAEPLLWAWTGDHELAHKAAPVLALYAVGNGVLALAAFPYYLQLARGEMRLHLIGNALFVVLFIPLLIPAVLHFGMVGAGYVWITANLLPFLFWLPVIHRRHLKGWHVRWLTEDILLIAVPASLLALAAMALVVWPASALPAAASLAALYGALLLVAAASSSDFRAWLASRRRTRETWP